MLAYSRDRPYNFSCLSAVSKNRRFNSFFSALRCHLARKAFRDQQCQFLTRNKSLSSENESNCSMTFEVRAYRFDFAPEAPASSTVDVHSRFSRFQFSAFWSNGLASSVFTFASILLRFFFLLSSSMQGLKYLVTDFLISTCEKSYASSKRTGWGKTAFWEVFRPYLDFYCEIKNSVPIYFALEYVEAVYQVSAWLTKL